MERDGSQVHQRQQDLLAIADNGTAFSELLLKERFSRDAVGIPVEHHDAVFQVRQHPGRHRAVIIDQIAFGDSLAGPENLVKIGKGRAYLRFRLFLLHFLSGPETLVHRLVVAHAQEDGVAQVPALRPFLVAQLDDQLGLHPEGAFAVRGRQGRRLPPDRL